MSWHYVCVKKRYGHEISYGVHEKFPDPYGWTEDPVTIQGDSKEDLIQWLQNAIDDIRRYDVIDATNEKGTDDEQETAVIEDTLG